MVHLFDRQSARLPGFDYTRAGAYFLTVATNQRHALFGRIQGDLGLNAAGQMVASVWRSMPDRLPHILIDDFVVMPDHFHGILHLGPENTKRLGDIFGSFKSITTVLYARGVHEEGWQSFPGRLWERNYYEHVIRTERALQKTRQYIRENVAAWKHDHR